MVAVAKNTDGKVIALQRRATKEEIGGLRLGRARPVDHGADAAQMRREGDVLHGELRVGCAAPGKEVGEPLLDGRNRAGLRCRRGTTTAPKVRIHQPRHDLGDECNMHVAGGDSR